MLGKAILRTESYSEKISDLIRDEQKTPLLSSLIGKGECFSDEFVNAFGFRKNIDELYEYCRAKGVEYGCLRGIGLFVRLLEAYSESIDRVVKRYKGRVDEGTFRLIEELGRCFKDVWDKNRKVIIAEVAKLSGKKIEELLYQK